MRSVGSMSALPGAPFLAREGGVLRLEGHALAELGRRFGTPLYVYHEIVHNRFVVEGLEKKGAVFVTELDAVQVGGGGGGFLASLLGSLHCAGMCGPIVGAVSLAAGPRLGWPTCRHGSSSWFPSPRFPAVPR